jgi:hypothetical protein
VYHEFAHAQAMGFGIHGYRLQPRRRMLGAQRHGSYSHSH